MQIGGLVIGGVPRGGMNGKTKGAESAYLAAQVADSPLARWRLSESSGTTATDDVGGYTGLHSGGVGVGAAGLWPGSRSADYNAAGRRTDVAALPIPQGSVTVEALVYCYNTSLISVALITGGVDGDRLLIHAPWDDVVYWDYGNHTGPGRVSSASGALPEAEWAHLVCVAESGRQQIWINGTIAASRNDPALKAAASTGIAISGRWFSGPAYYFAGRVQALAIYPHALAADRIAAHYAASGL